MELRDLVVTPIVLMLVYVGAYIIRPRVTDEVNRKYFLPALTVRIVGALALGFLYQFYYGGGDTFNYHTNGSRPIWDAFCDSPFIGLKLLFSQGELTGDTFEYASRITFYLDPSSFFIVRLSAALDLITFSSYSATAVLFAVFGFSGAWAFFVTFYRQAPHLHRWIAVATLFIPSTIFWGSGIMKDTVTLGCLGFLTFSIYTIFIKKKFSFKYLFFLALSVFIIFSVKKYILLCFLPAALLWIYLSRLQRVSSAVLRILLIPLVLIMVVSSSYYSVVLIGKDDPKYAVDKIAETAQITAYDIGFYSGKDAGSGYDLGMLDGTFSGMIKILPQAINVSLFRPYIWEVRNPLMLLSAFESLAMLIITFYLFFKFRLRAFKALVEPTVIFCFVFSLTFAFAVGASTFNFGTLARYKIPLLPFYILGIIFIMNYVKSSRKLSELERTE
jgi:hypothetical protein